MIHNKAVILIATRPDSKRLPNKVFKKIAGIPAIEHLLNRLSGCGLPVFLCIPDGCYGRYEYLLNKRIPNLLDLRFYEGNPDSPLHRMADCIIDKEIKADYVIRITHDDILIDQLTMLDLLGECVTNQAQYGISPAIVEGAGVEIIKTENLLEAAKNREEPTEFVSYFVKKSPMVIHVPRKSVCRNYRLTLDYEEDAIVLDIVYKVLGPMASLDKIVQFLDENPHILNINHIPEVSIYTSAYNACYTVGQTVSSIFWSNKNVDFEYIFVDDASTDETLLQASKYLTHEKPFKIIINEENKGLAYSSNVALDKARGKYVLRVDADDWLIAGAIYEMKKKLEEENSGIVYSSYYEVRKDREIIEALPQAFHHAGCALMDKRLINELRFSNHLRHWDSLDLYNRIKSKDIQVSYINHPLWYYRIRDDSLSRSDLEERKKTFRVIGNEGSHLKVI